MASMQRRLGPNIVGYYGSLQAFADALKLILKEYVSPTQAKLVLFFLGPVITLIFSLLGFIVIPYGPWLSVWDFNLGVLYALAVSSLSTYGILLAGWSANSKYAFLGSLRSTAQLISYELILSSAIILVILLSGSLSFTINIETQKTIWFALPLLPAFIIFFIGSVAETNRAPFDLAEAESELVSGFMTEHSAVIFVFFFLAEYASMVLICTLTSILFLGGYLAFPLIKGIILFSHEVKPLLCSAGDLTFVKNPFLSFFTQKMGEIMYLPSSLLYLENLLTFKALGWSLLLGIKTCVMIYIFIWIRASYPRIRFDQLMSFTWTKLLPIVIALIVFYPCVIFGFEIFPFNQKIF